MTRAARIALQLLLFAATAATLARAGWPAARLGSAHSATETCAVPVERAGEGVACLEAAAAAEAGLVAGDTVATDGTRGRMTAARLELFAVPVDLNRASLDELSSLPGVGPRTAEQIAAARPFASIDEILRVRGIGRKRLARLRARLIIR